MQKFINLFNGTKYISITEKKKLKSKYFPTYKKIQKNIFYIFFKEKRNFIKNYLNINNLVEHNNNIYINQEKEKHKNLLNNVKSFTLDPEQINCVLSDEDYSLIIAGAGSGKTLTIIGKIRYLIETKYLDENEILCISFTKESSSKLQKDLKKTYGYNINSWTFHKLALNILKDDDIEFNLDTNNTLNYLVDEFYDYIINDYPNIQRLVLKYFFGNKNKSYSEISTLQLNKFKKTIINFINLFKSNISNNQVITNYLTKVKNKNYYLLLNIIIIYNMYKIELNSQLEIDFDDLITKATTHINNNGIKKKYKYIIIDEYQDTSNIRVNLIKEIINQIHSKLIVVGDDFQSIYKFSGCNINTFLNFQKHFPNSKIFYINNNYRNSQEIINVAGNFIMKNHKQLRKNLTAHKSLEKPIKIIYYKNQKETFKKLINYMLINDQKNILILGRNNNDLYKIINNDKELKLFNCNLRYLTIHKSKGLEEDNIIIINLENATTGFPSKLKSHEITNLIFNEKENIKYDEERRLFYVALTRSKNYVYLLVNQLSPSIFIKELISDYHNEIEILSIK